MHEVEFVLPTERPFRLDLTVWVLRRRTKNIIDNWDGQTYRRVLSFGTPVLVTIRQESDNLIVKLNSSRKISATRQTQLEQLIRRMLGVNLNLSPFYKLSVNDPVLGVIVQRFSGVKPPRFPSLFETIINAISCQQLSLDAGIALLNRLAENFGQPFTDGNLTLYSFPDPSALSGAGDKELRQLGFSRQKARAINSLTFKLLNREIDLSRLESDSSSLAVSRLQTISGIGRWSAEYVLLRGLGRLDVFPGDDIGGQNNLRKLLRLATRPSYDELNQLLINWRPYAGLIYFHLLLNRLYDKGLISTTRLSRDSMAE